MLHPFVYCNGMRVHRIDWIDSGSWCNAFYFHRKVKNSIQIMKQNVSVLKQTELLGHQFTVFGTPENPLFLAKEVGEMIDYTKQNMATMLNLVDDDEKVKIFCTLDYQDVRFHDLHNKPCKSSSYNEAEEVAEFVENEELMPVKATGGANRWFLTEDGIYEVLMQSRTDKAKTFKKAVKKILHQIRTTGGYIPVKEEDDEMTILAKANLILQRTLERQNAQIEAKQVEIDGLQQDKQAKQLKIDALQNENSAKQEQINIQQGQIQSQANLLSQAKPKVEYYDMAMSSNLLYTTNQIALELGMSAVKLNQRLYADGVQYKQGITWILAAPYKDKGYAEIRTFEVRNFDNEVVNRKPLLKWTEKGRQFLLSKYKNNNTDNQ